MSQSKKRFGRSRETVEDDRKYAITDEDRQLTELAEQNLPRNRHAEAFTRSATRSGSGSTSATAETTDAPADVDDAQETAAPKRRKKSAARRELKKSGEPQPTPLWYKVVMIGLMIAGLLWIIVYYLFQGILPIPGIEVWNLVIGLGFMMTGLVMTTRWR